jgi:release factor glutamine methyltransferase
VSQVREALREAAAVLEKVSVTPRADAEHLMAHALGLSRSDMLLRSVLEAWQAPDGFATLVARRLAHEPMAYILGSEAFFGRSFRVTPDVLIPRGDSEVLIERALVACPDARRVLDCGTGSGCLLVTCLLELPQASGVGIDSSQAALHVAENNAQRLGLTRKQARFRLADWTLPGWQDGLGGPFDLVLANPPYVEAGAQLEPSVRHFEPAGALFAGPDGLDDYRVLIPQLTGLLAARGVAVVEIGAAQGEAVIALAEASGLEARLHRDLAGRARVVEMSRRA